MLLQLIEDVRFAVAVCTMTFTSSRLALLKLYRSIWIILTQYLPNPHAVPIRLFVVTLTQILHTIGLSDPRTSKSILFEGGRQNVPMTSFAIVTSTSWQENVPKHTYSGFRHLPVRPHVDGKNFTCQLSMYLMARMHRTLNFSYILRRDIARRKVYLAGSYHPER